MKRVITILLLCLFICPVAGFSQFKLMRSDENYSDYKDSVHSFYNSIKYIQLSKSGNSYMSVGGEARMEFVYFSNEDWGRMGIGRNPFFLQRYDVHADFHPGSRMRIFGQIRSAWESGRKNGPRPIDEDHLNIQNLFIDVDVVKTAGEKLTIRAGRQELDYGSGRLVSVREGPNLRLYFDGGKLMYQKGNFRSDVFVMMADTINTGTFDNKSSKSVNLWGSYSTLILPKSGNLEFYYLGIQRKNAAFEEGMANETRHSIGGRFFRYGGGFIYNFEGLYQFGKFGAASIHSWTASADIGYLFGQSRWKPSLNLRNDYISGDARPGDGKLQSFNPLYPKGGYFGFSPQIGPVNLIDIHPYATLIPGKKIIAQADVVLNWRYSTGDGLYRPSGNFNMAGSSSSKRYIGTAYLFSIAYAINKFISMNTGIQYFKTGPFIRDMISTPKDGVFVNTRLAVKF